VWAVLLTAPAWLSYVGGYTALASHVVIMGLVAMALNFLLGFTGVMSFGHAAYFGLGAYGTGLTLRYVANSTGLAMIDGILLGGIIGTVLGTLICKRRGVYFAMMTIAFGQIFYYIAYTWDSFTGGFDGLRGFVRQPIDLGFATLDIQNSSTVFYYYVLFVFAIAVGIAVDRHIWLSFSISCFFASTAGALYALLNNFADPTSLHYNLSGVIVIMVVMGGMRSFWGPLVGAAIYVVLQDYISSMTENWMSFVGLLFVLVVMFFPRGILGMLKTRSAS
jgi:branched-chain amino acid transport system permease protein